MGTTGRGYPYPEPTEPVAQGADAIKALATAVDTTGLVRIAAGTVSLNITSLDTNFTVPVTFPAGRFTAAPMVVTNGASFSPITATSATAINANGFTMNGSKEAGTGTLVCQWIAVQVG